MQSDKKTMKQGARHVIRGQFLDEGTICKFFFSPPFPLLLSVLCFCSIPYFLLEHCLPRETSANLCTILGTIIRLCFLIDFLPSVGRRLMQAGFTPKEECLFPIAQSCLW